MNKIVLAKGTMVILIILLSFSDSKAEDVIIRESSQDGVSPLTKVQKKEMAAKVGWMSPKAQRNNSHQTANTKQSIKETFLTVAQATEIIQNEKTALLNTTFYGDFRKAKKIKKTGKAVLEIWKDRAEYIKNKLRYSPEIYKLTVEYDEIWERKVDDSLTEEEKKKSWNDLDISKIYWKGNNVQASTLERKFISNPLTGEKFSAPIYKMIMIDDRSLILKNLSE